MDHSMIPFYELVCRLPNTSSRLRTSFWRDLICPYIERSGEGLLGLGGTSEKSRDGVAKAMRESPFSDVLFGLEDVPFFCRSALLNGGREFIEIVVRELARKEEQAGVEAGLEKERRMAAARTLVSRVINPGSPQISPISVRRISFSYEDSPPLSPTKPRSKSMSPNRAFVSNQQRFCIRTLSY
ncbi:hypothetical protein TL16_g04163 [Triparma laevis f. inornata]|uniref:Uncharacterized protein n=2 Tax=Triparma laevis TaxID=1534972 RepID=A0A9W7F5R1_9STRA|nr:hypothetical protein TL16_g04163 [Triparma laevis f. inornata]GMI01819.1 hypothetical protein TrLO_g3144 [Triparma laevis f. longispina]